MFNLSNLKNVKLKEVPKQAPRQGGGSTLVKRPTNGDLRVFANGRVYPSEALEAKYSLAYAPKIETPDPVTGELKVSVVGKGMDVFSSSKWTMVDGLLEEEVLFVGFTPRQGNPKIDVWGSCQFKDGKPSTAAIDQGASTFGRESLVPMLETAYGVDFEKTPFVDLVVLEDTPMISENGVYHLPKVVARGENKGKADYARRESIDIFPIVLGVDEIVPEPANTVSEGNITDTTDSAGEVIFEIAPETQEAPKNDILADLL